jgi:hypothetical protein
MDILEKQETPTILASIVSNLQYDKLKAILIGSAGLSSQLYTSDYDFMTRITDKYTPKKAFNIFNKIIQYIKKNDDLFFIEVKFQDKKGLKKKLYSLDDFTYTIFKKWFNSKLDFIKFDFVVYLSSKVFKELSINYIFNTEKLDIEDMTNSIKNDFKDQIKEGNYYKALKRGFSIIKTLDTPESTDLLKKLSKYFNSDIGKEYQRVNNLKAIKLVFEKYKGDELTDKKIETNLKDVGFKDIDDLDEYIKDLEHDINSDAYKFYKKNIKKIKKYI